MEKRTEGAWLVNHAKKLLEIRETSEFEDIELAGKCADYRNRTIFTQIN